MLRRLHQNRHDVPHLILLKLDGATILNTPALPTPLTRRIFRPALRTSPLLAIPVALALLASGCRDENKTETAAAPAASASPWPSVAWPLAEDPALEKRVDELLAKMTVEEKVGQLIQADIGVETLGRLAKIPNIVAIKDATGNLARVTAQRLACGTDFPACLGQWWPATDFGEGFVLWRGIGVDYAIYIFARMSEAMHQGRTLSESYFIALKTTGIAIFYTALTLAVGVAMWIWSDLKFQADMGVMLTFMFLVNMIAAIIFLPALCRFLLRPREKDTWTPTL